ncbi:bifunctional diaminohydroxyphosphoribosylaminopyrimidine deaminase/5-amino-6-(5-phosphoribosylamino)uracil reductase RibD, partial [Fulvivirga sp. RKSG066]|uniref:bifunctional diaminohydroxyphosphoribosylaminopyrimidine deaminase/5-amino-6-(5-phosphoribosylamino)uracil reductase RibD n=1 Tax=Fulvivirga aurantia TaxID=2529383 RepID=UPI0012BB9E1C
MKRAMDLAKLGLGNVSPNPLVGCVIVYENRIIGEGWHQKYGGPHAEVNAIESVVDKKLLPKSTLYVNLEPCAHFGNTPPCADLVVSHDVKKVVIANIDPNPKVAGGGIKKLKDAGIEVVTGICEKEGLWLNRRFFTYMERQRPYIILKWAQTQDSFVARKNYDSKWISNAYSRQLVHKWRSEEPAILVGYQTALHDNPQLNVRDWSGKDPLRLVIDPDLSLPKEHKFFDGSQKTVVYNLSKSDDVDDISYQRISNRRDFVKEILSDLYKRGVQSVIIEGGASTINKFINEGDWDEARVFI